MTLTRAPSDRVYGEADVTPHVALNQPIREEAGGCHRPLDSSHVWCSLALLSFYWAQRRWPGRLVVKNGVWRRRPAKR